MNVDTVGAEAQATDYQYVDGQEADDEDEVQHVEEQGEDVRVEQEMDEVEEDNDFSEDEELDDDMRKLQEAFPGFKHKYRLIKRIGEGIFMLLFCQR